MRKPIILLVDDDRAVLEALESSLAPALGAFCRVESFDDPMDVLGAVPRWREEQRSIAVAVVDQRMPGCTGVELLLRMAGHMAAAGTGSAAFDPCGSLRTILLTGFSDLEAVLAAKNHAGIDRFLEKPWVVDDLLSHVQILFRRYLTESGAGRFLRLYELRDEASVLECLRLRYAVLRRTKRRWFVQERDTQMDVDEFDRAARFLGLSEEDVLVGCARVTGAEPPSGEDILQAIVRTYPELRPLATAATEFPVAIGSYIEERDALAAFLDDKASIGEGVAEVDRATLTPALRRRPAAARLLFDGIFAWFEAERIQNALLACPPYEAAFYERYGPVPLPGTRLRHYAHLCAELLCLWARNDRMAPMTQARIGQLARRWKQTGDLCHCPSFVECFPGAYLTGQFETTDILCPRLAGGAV